MKKINSMKTSLLSVILLFAGFYQLSAQDATIHLLRPKQSMASGGSVYNVTVYLNDVRIDDLANGVAINYALTTPGDVTLKFQKEALGSNQGAPKSINLKVEKGGSYYYSVEATPNNLTIELLDDKKVSKLKGKASNFEATLDRKEDAAKPIVKAH
jgi:hypothetical protein